MPSEQTMSTSPRAVESILPEASPSSAAFAPTVAFQGTFGAFGELAALARWPAGEPRPMPTFERVVASVEAGISDVGLLPTWNSVLGEIPFTRGVLEGAQVEVTGEVEVAVELALLARRGATLETIAYVGSHPAALAQCRRWLAAHPTLTPCPAWDTAGAARDLADGNGAYAWHERLPGAAPRTLGAIAGAAAAERYGLAVLARGIQDVAENVTRFAILTRKRGNR
jgi:prephenate dehydratase